MTQLLLRSLKLYCLNLWNVIWIADNQFGFKTGYSADHCIYALKNLFGIIEATTVLGIHVFYTHLEHLIDSLENCLIEVCLSYSYESCYTGTEPKCFVLNRVPRPLTSLMYQTVFDKVGFYLPTFFTVYVDDSSNILTSACIGCHIHHCCTNHMFYAEDLCVIVLSPSGLQALLNICTKFDFENYIKYNPIKSNHVTFI